MLCKAFETGEKIILSDGKIILAGGEINLAVGKINLAGGKIILANGKIISAGGKFILAGGNINLTGGKIRQAQRDVRIRKILTGVDLRQGGRIIDIQSFKLRHQCEKQAKYLTSLF